MGWGGITNGKLMALAQQRFDVFVTVDQNLEYQQNLAKLTLGLVIVAVPDNNIKYFRPILSSCLTRLSPFNRVTSSMSPALNCEPRPVS